MVNTQREGASVIDEEAFRVTRSIEIAASADKVWRAITEPEHLSLWFGRTVLAGAGAGAQGTMSFDGYGAVPIRVESIDAPRSVTYRWNNDDARGVLPPGSSRRPRRCSRSRSRSRGEITRLTVVESGFERTSDPRANLESHRAGWELELDKLVSLLEAGR